MAGLHTMDGDRMKKLKSIIAPVDVLDPLATCVEWLPSAINCATTYVGDNRSSFVKLHTCKFVSAKVHQKIACRLASDPATGGTVCRCRQLWRTHRDGRS